AKQQPDQCPPPGAHSTFQANFASSALAPLGGESLVHRNESRFRQTALHGVMGGEQTPGCANVVCSAAMDTRCRSARSGRPKADIAGTPSSVYLKMGGSVATDCRKGLQRTT